MKTFSFDMSICLLYIGREIVDFQHLLGDQHKHIVRNTKKISYFQAIRYT